MQQRSIAALDLLLKAGADPNAGAENGQSPLRGAITWGWNDVIQFLAERGADINAPDNRGLTALPGSSETDADSNSKSGVKF